jgi:hypothetical protein
MTSGNFFNPSQTGTPPLGPNLWIDQLPESATSVLWLVVSTPLFFAGGFYLKKFSDTGNWSLFTMSMACYLMANLAFAELIKQGLAIGYLLSSISVSLALLGASAWHFHEDFSIMKGIAVALFFGAGLLLGLDSIHSANLANGEPE